MWRPLQIFKPYFIFVLYLRGCLPCCLCRDLGISNLNKLSVLYLFRFVILCIWHCVETGKHCLCYFCFYVSNVITCVPTGGASVVISQCVCLSVREIIHKRIDGC